MVMVIVVARSRCVPVIIYLLLIFLVPVCTSNKTNESWRLLCWLAVPITILHRPLHIQRLLLFHSRTQEASIRQPKQHSKRNCVCFFRSRCCSYFATVAATTAHIARKLSTILHTIDFLHLKSLVVRLACSLPDSRLSIVVICKQNWFLLLFHCCLVLDIRETGSDIWWSKQTRKEYHYFCIILFWNFFLPCHSPQRSLTVTFVTHTVKETKIHTYGNKKTMELS